MKVDIIKLKMESIRKREFPLFKLLEFRFFWNSQNGKAMPFARVRPPAWLAPLTAVPYMLVAELYNFGGAKYFIREENEVAGIVILKLRQDALILLAMPVSPIRRKRGVGVFVLAEAEKLAKQMKLPW